MNFKEFHAPMLYLTSIIVALVEITVFMISAASLELFLFNRDDGLKKLIDFIHIDGFRDIDILSILVIGIILSITCIFLNFIILKQVREKIIAMGVNLQKKIVSPYLALDIDFIFERNSKIDLKVFSESIVVITEGIFLQLYLALIRIIIVFFYSAAGIYIIGGKFLIAIVILTTIFGISFLIFSIRIKSLLQNINLFGERRLRFLSNFVRGRLDILLFGLPKSLIKKMDDALSLLLKNKISVITEVHKPRIVIEGLLIFVLISLGLLRVMYPDFDLAATDILFVLLTLRLLPALQQLTSSMRGAASANWAIDDIEKLLRQESTNKMSDKNKNGWASAVQFTSKTDSWISIQVEDLSAESPSVITLLPGTVNIIKGPSGVGKSTLLQTIIEALQEHEDWHTKLRNMTSFMPQDPITFLTSFKDNLLMGNSDTLDEKVALPRELGFTSQWVKLFDASATKNNMIVSGGEAQRLAFLRCIVDEGRSIILLDEPTSALDSELQVKVAAYIEELAIQGKFVVVITHNDLNIDNQYKRVINL
jgi:ABC-type transport system involved in cytochrome bd biosynthesis fused ATPase/permease subunit